VSLQFILGRAGTGKTRYCLQEIWKRLKGSPYGSSLVFLVPEQTTFAMERELVSKEIRGSIRAQVLSFKRMTWQVFLKEGGRSRIPLTEEGRNMVLRNIAQNNEDELSIFRQTFKRPGFIVNLAQTMAEFERFAVSEEKLTALENSLGRGILTAKLHDLRLIYTDYKEFLENSYTDPDSTLELLAEKIESSSFFDGAEFWVDDFSYFTPQEFLVLEKIMMQAKKVNITLNIDFEQLQEKGEDHLFKIRDTYKKLKEIAQECRVPLEEDLFLDKRTGRFADSSSLAFLETNYFNYSAQPFVSSPAELKIFSAVNQRAEVEGIARKIIALCQEKNYRFSEIAVLCRDLNSYAHLVQTIFKDYGIPYFLDEKREVQHHPLPELIRSILEAGMENLSYGSIFRSLKTGFWPLRPEEIALTENHVLAYGIRGKDWFEDKFWEMANKRETEEEFYQKKSPERPELINGARQKILSFLQPFLTKLKTSTTVTDFTLSLYEFLLNLRVPQTLEYWQQKAEEEGDLEEAKKESQIWEKIVTLFEQLVAALGENEVTLAEYYQLIDSGLESLSLGLIPPSLDQVLVISIERSRLPEVKAAFLLGTFDGGFPQPLKSEGILSDKEKEKLSSLDFELEEAGTKKLLQEEYLVYIALSRASAHLGVSYPLADLEGKAQRPSSVILRLKEMFPLIEEEILDLEPPLKEDPGDFITVPAKTLGYFGTLLYNAKSGYPLHEAWLEAYNWFLKNEEWRDKLKKTTQSVFWANEEEALGPKISELLFGKPIRSSISRLESFAACPFNHFLTYGLELRERKIQKLKPVDYGEFYHAVLKEYFEELKTKDLNSLTLQELNWLMGQTVEKLAPFLQNEILLNNARYLHLKDRLKFILSRSLDNLIYHLNYSSFYPSELEVDFGLSPNSEPYSIFEGKEKVLELTGRIDRLDIDQNKEFFRIIDYKTTSSKVDLNKIYYGLELQLLTYLKVAEEKYAPLKPAGAFYFPIQYPLKNGIPAADAIEKAKEERLKLEGITLAQPEVIQLLNKEGKSELFANPFQQEKLNLLEKHADKIYKNLAQRLQEGDISIKPYRLSTKEVGCRYCSYRSVCVFDPLLEENKYQRLPKLGKEEIWKKLEREVDRN